MLTFESMTDLDGELMAGESLREREPKKTKSQQESYKFIYKQSVFRHMSSYYFDQFRTFTKRKKVKQP